MRRTLVSLLAVGLLGLVAAAPARAQGRDTTERFEVEGHFGFYNNIAFPTFRDESADYTAFLSANVSPTLHSLLRPNARARQFLWAGGWRLSVDMNPKWALEYSFTFAQGDNFKFQNSYLNTVVPAAQAAVPTIQITDLRRKHGHIWINWVNILYHFQDAGKVIPYVTGGLNIVSYGRGPRIDLTDTATGDAFILGYERRHHRFGGNVGGGVKYFVSRNFGFRTDFRVLMSGSEFDQRGLITLSGGPTFGPASVAQQRRFYANTHLTFGAFFRF